MNPQTPDEVSLERFFEQLTWPKLEKRIGEALRYPNRSVPLDVHCPAVIDLAKIVIGKIGESAIQKPGELVSPSETFSFDQRVAVMRLLEAIISEYEEWRKRPALERGSYGFPSPLRSLENK